MTVNNALLDRGIRHAVYLEQLSAREVDRMVRFMDKNLWPDVRQTLDRRLARVAASGGDAGPWTTARYRTMMKTLDGQISGAMRFMSKEARERLTAIGATEAQWSKSMLKNNVPLDIPFHAPSMGMIRSIVTSRPFQGKLLREWYSSLDQSIRVGIREQINIGLASGESVPKITRRIMGTQAESGFTGTGTRQSIRRQVRAVVRTSTNHIAAGAREATYKANSDIIKKVRYVATLDARTTDICMSLDGKEYKIEQGPRPPSHHQCRSTTVPVTLSWKELGIKGAKDKRVGGRVFRDVKTGLNGLSPDPITYGQWLKRQPSEVQDHILGTRRATLMRNGRIPFDSIFKPNHHFKPLTGEGSLVEFARKEGITAAQLESWGIVPRSGVLAPEALPMIDAELFAKLTDFEQGMVRSVRKAVKEIDEGVFVPRGWDKMTLEARTEWSAGARARAVDSLDDFKGRAELRLGRKPSKPTKPTPKSTEEEWMMGSGEWHSERKALHNKIKSDAVKAGAAEEQPVFHMMGGGPASGKSVGINTGKVKLPKRNILVDSDEIKAALPEYKVGLEAGTKEIATVVHEESSFLSKEILKEAKKRKSNITLDGTGDSSIEKLTKKVQDMKDSGYRVVADYVTVDTEVALERNILRYLKTGRYVPDKVVSGTHMEISKVLPKAIRRNLFDELRIWDTNVHGDVRLIAELKNGKLVVHRKQLWNRFLRKSKPKKAKPIDSPRPAKKPPSFKPQVAERYQRSHEKWVKGLTEKEREAIKYYAGGTGEEFAPALEAISKGKSFTSWFKKFYQHDMKKSLGFAESGTVEELSVLIKKAMKEGKDVFWALEPSPLGGPIEIWKKAQSFIKTMDNAPSLPGRRVFYRGMQAKEKTLGRLLEEGATFDQEILRSMTSTKQTMRHFAQGQETVGFTNVVGRAERVENAVHLEIHTKRAVDIQTLGRAGIENEWVLQPGQKFRVIKVEKIQKMKVDGGERFGQAVRTLSEHPTGVIMPTTEKLARSLRYIDIGRIGMLKTEKEVLAALDSIVARYPKNKDLLKTIEQLKTLTKMIKEGNTSIFRADQHGWRVIIEAV